MSEEKSNHSVASVRGLQAKRAENLFDSINLAVAEQIEFVTQTI